MVRQLQIAVESRKPVIIHVRDVNSETFIGMINERQLILDLLSQLSTKNLQITMCLFNAFYFSRFMRFFCDVSEAENVQR